jgi:hypothetical protein
MSIGFLKKIKKFFIESVIEKYYNIFTSPHSKKYYNIFRATKVKAKYYNILDGYKYETGLHIL